MSASLIQHPGFEPDVIVTTTTPVLAEVFQGMNDWRRAVRDGDIVVVGPSRLVKAFPRWFLWSPFHSDTRARAAQVGPVDLHAV